MNSYARSSQRLEWTFTAESLADRRAAALCSVRETPCGAAAPPTAEQLLCLQRYYTRAARGVAQKLLLPDKVFSTCSLFLARAFLDARVLCSLDARAAMLACLYLAGKAEESYVSAEALAAAVDGAGGCSAAGLLAAELTVLRSTGFSLVTHTPQRCARGFLLAAASDTTPGDASALPALRSAATALCDQLMETDAPLLLSPGALGLACCLDACSASPGWAAALRSVSSQVEARWRAAAGGEAPSPLAAARVAVAQARAQPAVSDDEAAAADRAWKVWRKACLAAAQERGEGEDEQRAKRRKTDGAEEEKTPL